MDVERRRLGRRASPPRARRLRRLGLPSGRPARRVRRGNPEPPRHDEGDPQGRPGLVPGGRDRSREGRHGLPRESATTPRSTLPIQRRRRRRPRRFVTNGSGEPVPGAPFHDPCVDDQGARLSAGATGQFFDGRGGHRHHRHARRSTPTPRASTRAPTSSSTWCSTSSATTSRRSGSSRSGRTRSPPSTSSAPPEPLVLRMNTFDCVMYHHTNLVPAVYELDDFQIRTHHRHHRPAHPPAEVGPHHHRRLGQRLELRGRHALPRRGARAHPRHQRLQPDRRGQPGRQRRLGSGTRRSTPLAHPFFAARARRGRLARRAHHAPALVLRPGGERGRACTAAWASSSPTTTTAPPPTSRWGSTPPSSPSRPASTWVHNETGVPMYTRPDGGPTSWQARSSRPDRTARTATASSTSSTPTSSTPTSPASTSAATSGAASANAPDRRQLPQGRQPVGARS